MPLLDYGDVIYDRPENESFSSKTDPVQYNVSLVITGAVKGLLRRAIPGIRFGISQKQKMVKAYLLFLHIKKLKSRYNFSI